MTTRLAIIARKTWETCQCREEQILCCQVHNVHVPEGKPHNNCYLR